MQEHVGEPDTLSGPTDRPWQAFPHHSRAPRHFVLAQRTTMHWKVKAFIQNAVAKLPSPLSHTVYYHLQRSFGGLASINPTKAVQAAMEIATAISQNGRPLHDSVFLEVGTGRRLVLPIVMWLLGASRVFTVDLHRYLKAELVADDMACLRLQRDAIFEVLSALPLRRDRFEQLLTLSFHTDGLDALLEMCNIQYMAPADAARLPLGDGTIDFHVSSNVFEHIPPNSLASILREATRLLRHNGLAIHRIDHSDHFSHSDRTLSPIHFLRYNEKQWSRFAGNRYMYMNRLQIDDYERIFCSNGHEVLALVGEPNHELLKQLQQCPPPLGERFVAKPERTLATVQSMFVSRPRA